MRRSTRLLSWIPWFACAAPTAVAQIPAGAIDRSPAAIPLPEHPRPDFRRDEWRNLNGTWNFAFDAKDVGLAERWFAGRGSWPLEIVVPYAHQSARSGIGDTGDYGQVWYQRGFQVPESWRGRRVRLHVGAADFRATVWVNGREAGSYEGGYTPFWFDVTELLEDAPSVANSVTIRVFDDARDPAQPRGKQRPAGRNRWHYTHLTGIWQTVWLEAVGPETIESFRATTGIAPPSAELWILTRDAPEGASLTVVLRDPDSGEEISRDEAPVQSERTRLTLEAPGAGLWTPERPQLYGLSLELGAGGRTLDRVESYLGFRTVGARDGKFLLNGQPVWLNGVLDQGYYQNGLYTPSSDQAFVDDILWVKRLGLNHIRKHQMVPAPRFLYHCDRLGLLVWGEMANAAEGHLSSRATEIALREWSRVIERDFNHPGIATWVYSNENWMHGGPVEKRIAHYRSAYEQMKLWDPTRPVIDTSGYHHVVSDIMDTHYYPPQERLVTLYRWAEGSLERPSEHVVFLADAPYRGQPIMVSEWVNQSLSDFTADQVDQWLPGYLETLGSFAMHPLNEGHCYVQLYDIEEERNGYLGYNRTSKLNPRHEAILRAAHLQAQRRDLELDWNAFIAQLLSRDAVPDREP